MYWLPGAAALIGLAMIWGFAALLYWAEVSRILAALIALAGIVWALVFGWMAYDLWRLTQPLG